MSFDLYRRRVYTTMRTAHEQWGSIMSCIDTGMCARCPLTLAHKDPTWRFGDEHTSLIRPATLADEDVIGAYILTMPPEVLRNRYHSGITAQTAYEQRTEAHEKYPPDGSEHIEYVAVTPCGAIIGVCHACLDHGCHSIGVSVSKPLEGRGLASRLMQSTETHARHSRSVKALLAVTENGNHPMIALAKRRGYRALSSEERKALAIDSSESPWMLEL